MPYTPGIDRFRIGYRLRKNGTNEGEEPFVLMMLPCVERRREAEDVLSEIPQLMICVQIVPVSVVDWRYVGEGKLGFR